MAEKDPFSRLKRLFSSTTIIRNVGGNQVKVMDVDSIQQTGDIKTNSLVDRYNRIYTTNPSSLYGAQFNMNYKFLRPQLYSEYDVMDSDAIVASVLDIISDESTLKNDMGEILQIRSSNEDVQQILYNLFYDVLNVEFNLWSWIRQMCKYGDFFLKLEIAEKFGVYNVIPYTAYHIERQEVYDKENPSAVRFKYDPNGVQASSGYMSTPNMNNNDPNGVYFDNYEMAHFRLISDVNYLPFGRSFLEPARKLFKQYCLDGNSKVWTPNGYELIKNIAIGDEVITFNKDKKIFEKSIVKKSEQTGFETVYKLSTPHRNIILTKDHPILVEDGTYKTLETLTIHDKIIISNNIPIDNPIIPIIKTNEDDIYVEVSELGKKYLSNKNTIKCQECGKILKTFNSGAHLKIHNLNIEEYKEKWGSNSTYNITYNKQFIRGEYRIKLTDLKELLHTANLEFDINHYKYYYQNQQTQLIEDNIINDNISQIVRLFGFMLGDGWIDYNNGSFCFSLGNRLDKSMPYYDYLVGMGFKPTIQKDNSTLAQVNLSNLQLIKIFEDLGFKTGTMNKVVPEWVFNLPQNLQEEFVMGFVDADGCYRKNDDSWQIAGINESLMEDIKYICQRIGFRTTNIHKNSPDYKMFGDIKYEITTTCNTFSFKNIERQPYSIEKISKIIELEERPVYDIEVESENHNFIADGIVVHNCLMEDAMLIHRITRAPEKRIFYINVGSIPPNEVEAFMQKTISKMKRTPYLDKNTGEYNLKYNMQNMMEDFYIPVRGNDTSTKIDTAKGLEYTGLEDVEYLRNKLFAALKVPPAFMGYTERLEGKSTLSAQDIRFARTIDRIQRIVLSELNKIALVHLYMQGYKDESLTNFSLNLTTPSIIYDQERIELMKSKAELSQTLMDQNILPTDWIYDNIYHLSEDQFDEMRDLLREDAKRKFRLTQIENEGNDPQETGRSYGTPHDLASLYGKGRMYSDTGNVPEGYNADLELGRPKESITTRGKQENNFGKDPLGVKGMKRTDKNDSDSIRPNFKGGPLALESAKISYLQNKKLLSNIKVSDKKVMIFEQDDNISFLNEEQLKD